MIGHEAHRQPRPDQDIKCQTETWPPVRYPGVFNEPVMDEVKDSVPNHGSDYEPKISLEAEDGE
jgi:hypothetical protein